MLVTIQPSLTRYLPTSSTTMMNWVQDEFNVRKDRIKSLLKNALSKIHISFDIWTSLNCKPILAVQSHFLSRNIHGKYEVLGALLDMVELIGVYDGGNIAKALIKVVEDWEIDPTNMGISVSDNAINNDTTVKA